MIAAIYNAAGTIVQSIQGTEVVAQATARALGMNYLEIDPVLLAGINVETFDQTHKVVGLDFVLIETAS